LEILSNLPFHSENKGLGNAIAHFLPAHVRVAQEIGDAPQKRQANYRNPDNPLTWIDFDREADK
jgi:hypothetical protein